MKIDRTAGRDMLKDSMEIACSKTPGMIEGVRLAAEAFRMAYKDKEIICHLLSTYHTRSQFNIYDTGWYSNIVQMIHKKQLYMTLIEIPKYAYPDKDYDKNVENLSDTGIKITKENKGNSDGLWSFNGVMKFARVYKSDKDTPKDKDVIEVSNPRGVVEFGYQPICKSAYSLSIGECLLRVPYELSIPFKNPVCAIFLNKIYLT